MIGRESFTAQQLAELDLNEDGVVDVADLVFYLQEVLGELPIDGFKWLVSASFTSEFGSPAPFAYGFSLELAGLPTVSPIPDFCDSESTTNVALVGELRELDPTRGVLTQDVSAPGQTPGVTRPAYQPSRVIPVGTRFCRSELGDVISLKSEPVIIDASDPTNPTGQELTRVWTLEIYVSTLEQGTLSNGIIIDELYGFLPNDEPVVTAGSVFLSRFEPLDLEPVEIP